MMNSNRFEPLCEPFFSQNALDRMDHLRPDILAQRLGNLTAQSDRYLLLCKGKVLLKPDGQSCFFSADELPPTLLASALCVFLGVKNGMNYYTLAVSEQRVADIADQEEQVMDIRSFALAGLLPEGDLGLLAEANSLLSWHSSHGFCARCGTKSEVAHGGWRRDCPDCQAEHFPRTDPVVIMLVTYGDQCLLGRGHNFDEKRFSCLAGFMEPGETIAQAARRELFEEAGVTGGKVSYLCDQPWPFPSNLMIGVHVQAQDQALNVDFNELAEVMWVDKSDVVAVLNGDTDKSFLLPPKVAIARNLLELYCQNQG